MTVAAVIVRWKGGEEVERCLRSLLALGEEKPAEIVLVDSGSDDGGAEHLSKTLPEIRVEALAENSGFAAAANHGVSTTDSDLIFLLNPDTEIQRRALRVLTAYLEKRPDLAGVVPLLENSDGSSQHLWQLKKLPTKRDLGLGRPGKPAFILKPEDPEGVTQPAAAAWLIRRSVWEALGGLDPTFFPAWWEDVDFCARLQSRLEDPAVPWNFGWKVVPEARVRHIGGSSVKSMNNAAFLQAFFTNLIRYAERHHDQDFASIRRALRIALAVRATTNPGRMAAYLNVRKML